MYINTWRLQQYGYHFADDIFKFIVLYENGENLNSNSTEIQVNNKPVQIMAWHQNWWQTIIWTNDAQVTDTYASLCLNELKHWSYMF